MIAKTHAMRALIDLRQRIFSGDLAGGTRLYEVALAEDLQVSRTPIRAAMSQLAEEGLLERASGGGFVVRSFAVADVLDTLELRGVLEGTAARMAAERGIDDAQSSALNQILSQLDQCFENTDQSVDLELYSQQNILFHSAFSKLPKSAVIEREIDRVTRLPFASPSAFLPNHARIDEFHRSLLPSQEQHHALVDAIMRREGSRAEAVAREHAQAARRNIEHLFRSESGKITDLAGLALIAG